MGRRSTHRSLSFTKGITGLFIFALMAGCAGPQSMDEPSPAEKRYLDLQTQIASGPSDALETSLWRICSELHDARPWISLGYIYYEKGDIEKSLACYGFALHYDPENRSVQRWFLQNRRELYTGQATLRWKKMRMADGYNVFFQLFQGSPWVRINAKPVIKPEFKVYGLKPEQIYSFKISALQIWSEKDIREGSTTPPFRKKAFLGKLAHSKRLTAEALPGGRIRLIWQKSQETWVEAYHLYVLMPGASKPSLVTRDGPTQKTRWLLSDLPRGMKYKIIIAVVGQGGREEVFSEANVTIPLE